jgi:4-diphosphocytidyl-2-C-methyl-D-erythritol kinase
MTNILRVNVTAHAKINLSLRIVGKREDGYHLLESLVVFAKYGDLVAAEQASELSIQIIGEFADALAHEPLLKNLVWRAALALQAHLPFPKGAKITLTKNLPIGSGIGGGSADAAATLKALCALWKLEIPHKKLMEIGLQLGSDVPVCLYGNPALMSGIGEQIAPATAPSAQYIILINPNISLATAEVFSAYNPSFPNDSGNDLQPAAIDKLPIIGELLTAISKTQNCQLTQMSGSGATCFGLYENKNAAISAMMELKQNYPQMWCITSKILD